MVGIEAHILNDIVLARYRPIFLGFFSLTHFMLGIYDCPICFVVLGMECSAMGILMYLAAFAVHAASQCY
jgi:hypothetical protein